MLDSNKDFFKSFDGTSIFYRSALPQEKVKAVVVLVHGWGEHSGHSEELSGSLVSTGLGVYALDLRGYGRSGGQKGYIREWSDYLNDLYFLIKIAKKNHNKSKLFLIGHSMGGVVSIRFIQTYAKEMPMDGLILSAPMLKLAIEVPKIKIKLGNFMSKWIPRLSLPNALPTKRLTRDPQKRAEIENDPYFHFQANSRWYTEVTKAMLLSLQEANKINISTLILHGIQDKINDPKGSQEFFNNLKVKDKKLFLLEEMLHNLFEEVDREKTFSTVNQWITKHL